MKLFTALFTIVVATAGVAVADARAQPAPSGPMLDEGAALGVDVDVDVQGPPGMVAPGGARGEKRGRGRIGQALRARFDRNHDGRLEPRERRAAIRFLRRRARQLARGGRGRQRMGQGAPGQMPPAR
jgi:hypothetical protein